MRTRSLRTPSALLAALSLLAGLTPTAQSAPLRDWPACAQGDRGVNTRALQYLLLAHGCSLPADGVFGPATGKALRRFQAADRLVPTGKMNDATWESLIVPLRQGSKGPAVKAAQVELRGEGYGVAVDGVFGPRMREAVRKLQARTGHTADGIIGRNSWYEMLGGNDTPLQGD